MDERILKKMLQTFPLDEILPFLLLSFCCLRSTLKHLFYLKIENISNNNIITLMTNEYIEVFKIKTKKESTKSPHIPAHVPPLHHHSLPHYHFLPHRHFLSHRHFLLPSVPLHLHRRRTVGLFHQ